jgi:acyl dehydratase
MALVARQLYFEAVKVGDELPPLVKPPVDRSQIARYSGASGDFNPLYVDEHQAKNAGFPSAHVPGMLVMGFIGELVADWLRGARLRRFTARFVKIVWPGDVITSRGRVVDRRFEGEGVYTIDIEVWAENQRGELVLKGLVNAQLYYSAEDDAGQRSGRPPLVVTQEEEAARLAKLSRAQPLKRQEPRPVPALPRPAPASAVARPASPPAGEARPVELEQGPSAVAEAAIVKKPAVPGAPARPVARAARSGPRPARSAAGGPGKRPAAPRSSRGGSSTLKRQGKPRAAPRPLAKVKPAARASRPRSGSKPTGKKRR